MADKIHITLFFGNHYIMKTLKKEPMTMYTDPYRPKMGATPELDYDEIIDKISKELELFANIPLSTCLNNNINSMSGKYVNNGLTLYFIIPEDSIWISQIEQNPNVALTYMSRQIKGKGKNLGDPFDPKHKWVIDRHKIRHRETIETLVNIPNMTLLEVEIIYITIFEFTRESPGDMRTVQVDVENRRAFWTYMSDSPTMMNQTRKKSE